MRGVPTVVDRISEVVSPILWALGLELVDVVCVGKVRGQSFVCISINQAASR